MLEWAFNSFLISSNESTPAVERLVLDQPTFPILSLYLEKLTTWRDQSDTDKKQKKYLTLGTMDKLGNMYLKSSQPQHKKKQQSITHCS